MRLFARRPPKPDVSGAEPVIGLAIIRRIKVTIDRYWLTSVRQTNGELDHHSESLPASRDVNKEEGG
jgi:hypothetical protein